MRQELDLQKLRKSRNRKHQKIYKKACRIMDKNLKATSYSTNEIADIAKMYPMLSVKMLIGGDIYVKSKLDDWIIHEEDRYYVLYHKGYVVEKRRIKERYHVQDVFFDLEYIFDSIVSHDEYKMGMGTQSDGCLQPL